MSHPLPLTEQVIVITGASTGIGAALAQVLARCYPGVRLALAARNGEKLAAIAEQARTLGADVLAVPTDIGQVEQAKTLAHKALDHFGHVNSLVNNAGYGQMGPVELIPAELCRRQYEVNVLGPLALTQTLIPPMRDQGGGRIVNISSLSGRTAFPFGALYSSSKFALEALSDALRMELEPFNIQVSVIEPGPVSTDFFAVVAQEIEQAIPDPHTSPYRAAFQKLEGLEQQTSFNAWTSEQVANVIISALESHRPRPRYIAMTGGGFVIGMLTKVLPTTVVDKFWQKFYGIDLVATDWQQRPKNS